MTAVFQQLTYNVEEDDSSVAVCVAVVSATAGTLATSGTVTITFADVPVFSASMSN